MVHPVVLTTPMEDLVVLGVDRIRVAEEVWEHPTKILEMLVVEISREVAAVAGAHTPLQTDMFLKLIKT